MLTVMPGLAIGAGSLMASFLVMSALAMLIVVLTTWLYVATMSTAGTSRAIDAGLATLSFVIGKLWIACLLPVIAFCNVIGGGVVGAIAAMGAFGSRPAGGTTVIVTVVAALAGAAALSGSLTAWTRLAGPIKRRLPTRGRRALGLALLPMFLAAAGGTAFAAAAGAGRPVALSGLIDWLLGCALLAGVLTTLSIQKARMPVVLYFSNALIGLAIGLEGLALGSPALLVAGLLVGAARILLTLPLARLPDIRPVRAYGDMM